jgi:glutamate-1-semialdehyde 2,1-aminomutase
VVSIRTWPQSAELHQLASSYIPGGVNSNVRLSTPQVFFERGTGAWLWDVDGNDYVDYLLGQGPHFLGHANTRVNDAVARACTDGMLFGAQSGLEIEAARRTLSALGWADLIRFGMTGTECVQAALRLARAKTGRSRFVRFEGHYHGWLDNVLLGYRSGRPAAASEGQLRTHIEDSVVLSWNDVEALA